MEEIQQLITKEHVSTTVLNLKQHTKDYIVSSLSDNTLKAYISDFKVFRNWCTLQSVNCLPATASTVANFLAAQAQISTPEVKASTLSRRLAAIRYIHKMAGLPPPTEDSLVRQTLRGIMREKLTAPAKKAPMTQDIIHTVVEQIDTSTLLGIRDRAIILLGFAGAFRRSELANVRIEDLNVHESGMDIFMRFSKTDQIGEGFIKPIIRGTTHCPVEATQAWLTAAELQNGFLFRKFVGNSNSRLQSQTDSQKPEITGRLISRVIKKYCSDADLDHKDFSGHSLRSGFVTAALLNGASYEKIMEVTGQKDIKTLMKYYQNVKQYEEHAGEGLL